MTDIKPDERRFSVAALYGQVIAVDAIVMYARRIRFDEQIVGLGVASMLPPKCAAVTMEHVLDVARCSTKIASTIAEYLAVRLPDGLGTHAAIAELDDLGQYRCALIVEQKIPGNAIRHYGADLNAEAYGRAAITTRKGAI